MSEGLIKQTFVILGTLLVSIIMFTIIFGTVGQQFMWRAIEPAMINQWQESTLDNGAERTIVYEDQYDKLVSDGVIFERSDRDGAGLS